MAFETHTVMEHQQAHTWTLIRRVLPQHTDHAGVMWHGAYLAWLEEARVEALAEVGLSIQYLQPLRHGDLVDVASEVLPRRGLKLTWSSRFLSGQELAAEARVDLVLVECHAQVMATAEGGPLFRLRRRWPDDLASAASALARGQG